MFAKLKEEFLLVLPPTIFFLVGFNLIALSANLILAEYLIRFVSFFVATTSALVVGKAVLVADKMPFMTCFDTAPLIQPILFKTAIYWAFVFIARLLEGAVHYLIEKGTLVGFSGFLADQFSWHRFAFIQLWILVLFLIYVTVSEFNKLFGSGELARILFTRYSSRLRLTRRQRVRTLVQLGKLAAEHKEDDLLDPDSEFSRECLLLVRGLVAKPAMPTQTARP
jgi:hypothetical protein